MRIYSVMHVVVDGRALQSPVRSGVPRLVAEMLRTGRMLEEADQVTVFTSGLRKPVLTLREGYHHLHIPLPNKLLHSLFFLRLLRVETCLGWLGAPQADALFVPNFHFFHTRLPFWVLVHDLSFLRAPFLWSLRERLVHWLKQTRSTMRRAAKIFAVSASTAHDVLCVAGREAVVRTPFVFTHAEREQRAGGTVLFLGTLEQRKNVEVVIEGFLQFSLRTPGDWRLVLAGAMTPWAHALQRRYTAEARIVWRGAVSDAEREDLLQHAYALVLPSWYEGYGMPIDEALQRGVPVLVARGTALPATGRGQAIVVQPERAESVCEGLLAVGNFA